MGIVAAGMHHTCCGGFVGNIVLFLDGEGVHVSPDTDNRLTLSQFADHSGLAYARPHPAAEGIQNLGHFASSAVLVKSQVTIFG